MPNICVPCSSVGRLLDSGQFRALAGADCHELGHTGHIHGVAQSIHNEDLKFLCSS